jgi:hypothetical protein
LVVFFAFLFTMYHLDQAFWSVKILWLSLFIGSPDPAQVRLIWFILFTISILFNIFIIDTVNSDCGQRVERDSFIHITVRSAAPFLTHVYCMESFIIDICLIYIYINVYTLHCLVYMWIHANPLVLDTFTRWCKYELGE